MTAAPPVASGPDCAVARREVLPRRRDGQTNSGAGARVVMKVLVCACEKRGLPGQKEVSHTYKDDCDPAPER